MSLFWCYGKNPGLYVVCNWWWIHSTRASPLVHQIAATITSLRVFHLHFQFSNFVDFDFFVPHSTLRVFYVKFSKWFDCTEYFCMVITEISFSRTPPPLLLPPCKQISHCICAFQEVLHLAQTDMQLAATSAFLQILQKNLVPIQNYSQTFLQTILNSVDSKDPGNTDPRGPILTSTWIKSSLHAALIILLHNVKHR